MPRRKQPARLYLRGARDDSGGVRGGVWYIVDGKASISAREQARRRLQKAEEAYAAYVADRHAVPSGTTSPKGILVDEVLSVYLHEHAEDSISKAWIGHMAGPILE